MNQRLVSKTAENLVKNANTEQELIDLIEFHSAGTNYGGRGRNISDFDQLVARYTVKRAHNKLSTFG